MFWIYFFSALLIILLIVLTAIYKYSLHEDPRADMKNKVVLPTDYDGMGTYSRYIGK